MYLITVEKDNVQQVKLWSVDSKPVYFDGKGGGEWSHAEPPIARSTSVMGWSQLKKIAKSLGLKPGPEGITEVEIEIKCKA